MESEQPASGGVAGLSRPARVAVRSAVVLAAVAVVAHFALVIVHVAPSTAASRPLEGLSRAYISPEFSQNWKLFAPNPLATDIAVHARAQVRQADGTLETTGWKNLTAKDIEDTAGSLAPSRTRNQLRKGWSLYVGNLGSDKRPRNQTGQVVERFLLRVAILRLREEFGLDNVERLQMRSASVRVPEPSWSDRRTEEGTSYRETPWWPVTEANRSVRSRP